AELRLLHRTSPWKNSTSEIAVFQGGLPHQDAAAILQVRVPLYSGGGLAAQERASMAVLHQTESDLESARRTAVQEVRENYFSFLSNSQQTLALQAAIRSSALSLDSNSTAYQAGLRMNVDVLNAQQQLFDIRQKLSKARYDALLSQLRLKAAIGQLSSADLALIDEELDLAQGEPLEL
ncbi:MAG: TolC family protein, partial [Lautropia sp.]|nr:TolC family protein [Lautropia sp.]